MRYSTAEGEILICAEVTEMTAAEVAEVTVTAGWITLCIPLLLLL